MFIYKRSRKSFPFWLLIGAVITFTPGFDCGTGVKQFGSANSITPTPASISAGSENYRISFAVRTTNTSSDLYFQGTSTSSASIQAVCGSGGINCVCDFFTDADGNGKVSSASGSSVYNVTGNYLYCTVPAGSTPASFTHARMRDRSNQRFTNTVEITNQDDADATKRLTLQKVLGDLPAVDVRKISEYRCYYNYLKKSGTTTSAFNCSAGALSIVQIPYHYYLFADNRQNNFNSRVPDILHNDGRGSLCGALLKFIDCSTAEDGPLDPNELQVRFGLYNRIAGLFTIPIQVTNAPARMGGVTTVVGYAAKYDTTTLSCPPGLEARQLFKATPSAITDSQVSASLIDSRWLATNGAANLLAQEFTGGTCNGNTCSAPNLNRDSVTPTTLQTVSYTAQTGTNERFCALPASLLNDL